MIYYWRVTEWGKTVYSNSDDWGYIVKFHNSNIGACALCIVGLRIIMHFEVCIEMQCALLLCSLVCEVFNASVNLLAQRLTNIKAQQRWIEGWNKQFTPQMKIPATQAEAEADAESTAEYFAFLLFYCWTAEPLPIIQLILTRLWLFLFVCVSVCLCVGVLLKFVKKCAESTNTPGYSFRSCEIGNFTTLQKDEDHF